MNTFKHQKEKYKTFEWCIIEDCLKVMNVKISLDFLWQYMTLWRMDTRRKERLTKTEDNDVMEVTYLHDG